MYSHASPPPPRSSRSHGTPTKSGPQQYVPPITIAVMGATGSGKTSFINMASDSNLPIGMVLESCTSDVYIADEFTLDGRQVILFDMPSFDDTNKSDTDILRSIATFLATAYEAGSKLTGVIYIHRISDRRFTGIFGRNFKIFRELCGDSTLKNVILVTNMWGEVTQDVGEAREQELITDFFKPALDKEAQLARHHNTAESAQDIIRRIIKNKPITLQIQRELVNEHKDIIDTAAGKELNEQIRPHPAELKAIREEMMQALEDKDEEMREELEKQIRKLKEQMDNMRKILEGMELKYQEEKRRMEEAMRQAQERARREREQAEAGHRKQMEELEKRLRESISASAEKGTAQGRTNRHRHQEGKSQLEEEMRQMEEQARQEREQAQAMRQMEEQIRREWEERARREREVEAEYRKQMEELEKRLRESSSASPAEREAIREQINQLQRKLDNLHRGCLIM